MVERLFTLPGELYDPDEIVATAIGDHGPRRTFVLCSGGNDSMVLLHAALEHDWHFDAVVHVNTLTGVCEKGRYLTTDFVHEQCRKWGVPLVELRPPETYEEVFIEKPIINGLPGPGMHFIAYNRLKERALNAFVKTQKRPMPLGWKDRIMLLTGIREEESQIRMGYADTIIDRRGVQVWVNPIYRWTNLEMVAYRKKHSIPQNPVAAMLHLSGECLCGAYASPGEREEIRFWYPETAARIDGWEQRARERGLKYWQWGTRRGREPLEARLGMCRQCVSLFDFVETTKV